MIPEEIHNKNMLLVKSQSLPLRTAQAEAVCLSWMILERITKSWENLSWMTMSNLCKMKLLSTCFYKYVERFLECYLCYPQVTFLTLKVQYESERKENLWYHPITLSNFRESFSVPQNPTPTKYNLPPCCFSWFELQ